MSDDQLNYLHCHCCAGTLAAVKRRRKMATDAIVEAVDANQGQAVTFAGPDRRYFCSKNALAKRWAMTPAVSKGHKKFARRTELKVQRTNALTDRRAAGAKPWRPEPPRTGQLHHTPAHGPDGPDSHGGLALQPRLKVYPAFAAWAPDLPALVGGGCCTIMRVDHGRGIREADVVVLAKCSDLQLRNASVAQPLVYS